MFWDGCFCKQLVYKGFLKQMYAEDLQGSVRVMVEPKAFLEDGHNDVDRDGDPNLRLDGVLRGSEEGLDAEVLLDPCPPRWKPGRT